MIGRPKLADEKKARQVNFKFPPDIIEYLNAVGKNKTQLVIDAIRKTYKIKVRK